MQPKEHNNEQNKTVDVVNVTPIKTGPPPIPPLVKPSKISKPPKSGVRGVLSTVLLFVSALLLAICINAFVFQSYEVDGSSMQPTLQNGNRLIIWKLPRTIARLTGNDYQPSRGDIVVFHKKGLPSEQLIKRVIGLPGERVVVANGSITVFNDDHPEGFNPDSLKDYGATLEATYGTIDQTVEAGKLFVCGDNRVFGGSLDSRSSLGTIELSSIVGVLKMRIFPFNEIDTY